MLERKRAQIGSNLQRDSSQASTSDARGGGLGRGGFRGLGFRGLGLGVHSYHPDQSTKMALRDVSCDSIISHLTSGPPNVCNIGEAAGDAKEMKIETCAKLRGTTPTESENCAIACLGSCQKLGDYAIVLDSLETWELDCVVSRKPPTSPQHGSSGICRHELGPASGKPGSPSAGHRQSPVARPDFPDCTCPNESLASVLIGRSILVFPLEAPSHGSKAGACPKQDLQDTNHH